MNSEPSRVSVGAASSSASAAFVPAPTRNWTLESLLSAPTQDATISFRCSREQKERFYAKVKADGSDVPDLLREFVRDYLADKLGMYAVRFQVADPETDDRVAHRMEVGAKKIEEVLKRLDARVSPAMFQKAPHLEKEFKEQRSDLRNHIDFLRMDAMHLRGQASSLRAVDGAKLAMLQEHLFDLHRKHGFENLSADQEALIYCLRLLGFPLVRQD